MSIPSTVSFRWRAAPRRWHAPEHFTCSPSSHLPSLPPPPRHQHGKTSTPHYHLLMGPNLPPVLVHFQQQRWNEKDIVGNQERDHSRYVHGEENEHATGVLPDYRQGPPEPELGRLVRWIDHHSVAQWDHRHLWPGSRSGRVAWLAQESA